MYIDLQVLSVAWLQKYRIIVRRGMLLWKEQDGVGVLSSRDDVDHVTSAAAACAEKGRVVACVSCRLDLQFFTQTRSCRWYSRWYFTWDACVIPWNWNTKRIQRLSHWQLYKGRGYVMLPLPTLVKTRLDLVGPTCVITLRNNEYWIIK